MKEAIAEGVSRGTAAVQVRAEARVGTICLSGPCTLCGRDFDVQNWQARLATGRETAWGWCASGAPPRTTTSSEKDCDRRPGG